MVTARILVQDALSDIQVISLEKTLTEKETAQAIRYVNRLAGIFANDGLNVGFQRINSLDDQIDIPDWIEDLFITWLGIRLAPSYGVIVDQRRLLAATQNYKKALNQLVRIPEAALPDNLHVGAGNRDEWFYQDFFQGSSEDDLTNSSTEQLTDDDGGFLSV